MENIKNVPTTSTSAHDKKTQEGVTLRFECCIGCPDLGIACSGPNLALLTVPELRLWANRWREHYKLSVVKCAAAWDMSEGTVSRFLSSNDPDFRFVTIQSIIQGIIRYGLSADQQNQYHSCPATTAQIQEQAADLERQLIERTEECAELTARKLDRANEFTERMAEQRENYEKHMAEKENTIAFLRELAAKRQNDLEKSEAVARNYLDRIDSKNAQLAELNQEIRRLNGEILRMASSYAAESKRMVDRVIQMSEAHAADFLAMHFGAETDLG
jgi:hypothetical protein